jgi:hypothetical protein
MPKFYKQNKKKINPRYFLNETVDRGEEIDEGLQSFLTGLDSNDRGIAQDLAIPLARARGVVNDVNWDNVATGYEMSGEELKQKYMRDEKFRKYSIKLANKHFSGNFKISDTGRYSSYTPATRAKKSFEKRIGQIDKAVSMRE